MPASQGSRRFHEAGVGSRTGLRLSAVQRDDDGMENLDDFYKASQKAMDRGNLTMEEEDEEDDDDDYSRVGSSTLGDITRSTRVAARQGRQSMASKNGVGSSSMDLESSMAPSPRTAIRRQSRGATSTAVENSEVDYDEIPGSSSRSRIGQSRGNGSVRPSVGRLDADTPDLNDFGPSDDNEEEVANVSSGSRTFDLSGDAEAEFAAMESGPEEEDLPTALSRRRAPSAGLAARRAASQRKSTQPSRPAYLDSDEDEDEEDIRPADVQMGLGTGQDSLSSPEQSARLVESVEYDAGPSALRNTAAGREERASAAKISKGRKRAPADAATKSGTTKRRGRPKATRQTDSEDGNEEEGDYIDRGSIRVDKRKITSSQPAYSQKQVVENVGRSSGRAGSVTTDGVRRSTRHRYKPLDWWRGEHIVYGRPSLPAGMTAEDLREAMEGSDDESPAPRKPPSVPVPVVKAIVRIEKKPGDATFAGMNKRPRVKRNSAEPPQKKKKTRRRKQRSVSGDEDDDDEDDSMVGPAPTARTVHPEAGWDRDLSSLSAVIDAETGQEVTMPVSFADHMVKYRDTYAGFQFFKAFSIGSEMAGGRMKIPPGGSKTTKSSKNNHYFFFVFEGAVNVVLHRRKFTMCPGGIFYVPAGNNYSITNICQREAHIAFAQVRKAGLMMEQPGDATEAGEFTQAMIGSQSMRRPPPSSAADASASAEETDSTLTRGAFGTRGRGRGRGRGRPRM